MPHGKQKIVLDGHLIQALNLIVCFCIIQFVYDIRNFHCDFKSKRKMNMNQGPNNQWSSFFSFYDMTPTDG